MLCIICMFDSVQFANIPKHALLNTLNITDFMIFMILTTTMPFNNQNSGGADGFTTFNTFKLHKCTTNYYKKKKQADTHIQPKKLIAV